MKTQRIILAGVLCIITLGVIVYISVTRHTSTNNNRRLDASHSSTYNDIRSQLHKGDKGTHQETDPYDLSSIDIGVVRLYDVTILGTLNLTEKLYENMDSVTVVQRDIIAALLRYGEDYLKKQYSTLTIIPNSIETTRSSAKMLINLGETDKKVGVSVTILNNLRALITIDGDSDKGDFIYAGGLYNTDYAVPVTSKDLGFSIKQEAYSRELHINSATDKEKALDYISSLGYGIPDFSITFIDYRSPFE